MSMPNSATASPRPRSSGLPRATIDQAAAAALVITLGPDIKDDVPVLYLRLRDAVRENGTAIVELTLAPTGLTRYAAETVTYRPGGVAALAAAVGLGARHRRRGRGAGRGHRGGARPHRRAGKWPARAAAIVVVILGRPSLAEPEDQVAGAARILAGLPGVAFLSALRRRTSTALSTWAWPPACCPAGSAWRTGRAWYEHHWGGPAARRRGLGTAGILDAASRGHIGGLVLVGADPRRDFPDAQLA